MVEPEETEKTILLNTIKFPKNFLKNKKEIELPKSNYNPVKIKKIDRYFTTVDNENGLNINKSELD